MMDKELCFIIESRKLFLEQVLVDYNEIPIFFLCKNEEQYYIVLCTDIDDLRYIVTKLSIPDVYNLLHGNIPMRDAILKQKEYWDVVSDDDVSLDQVTRKSMDTMDLAVLPKKNLSFRVLTESMETYVRSFDNEFFSAKNFSEVDSKPDWCEYFEDAEIEQFIKNVT